ncbi:MAG: NAD(P)H-dependent glycerol-3-phosphate dehydrogenase [Candidatus Faecousia sp.]|nr:NAD(P)-dependent glycerol-3-phosphate dehydrogenase [Clostridiales bacterium]MDD7652145.1 NAD(P)-dependent glycerol-3-phosphate dehydrogenase [Bacillota bacterium]MDY4220359.1 NAD(P)H-dependent glycerol-3-phosphate dehydrogenase [Candidatus Faecousia sp.]
MNITVAGSGGWGTALAIHLCKNGHEVTLWSHNPEKARAMEESRENPMLPGIPLPRELALSGDPASVAGRELVVLASPSFPFRSVCKTLAPHLDPGTLLVSVAKGIEPETLERMSQIAQEETGHTVAVLSGPSHAEEVARGIPTGCVSACADRAAAELVQDVFMSDRFRVYVNPDVVGVELGGALKNVIALCAGICDGLGFGDNTKAMLMTRGLTETARLGLALGARQETFAGLAGVGDLIVTCTSMHSRNRRAGILIGQGATPKQAMEQVGAVVEGYFAARSAHLLAEKLGADMPIASAAYRVLYEGAEVRRTVDQLLRREKRAESEDARWDTL